VERSGAAARRDGVRGGSPAGRLRLGEPETHALRAGVALALLAATGCSHARPNILLIVADTARADRFSCDGYARPTTPRIDALAREGAVYLEARTPAPWTVPAHASLFTGLEPRDHGADSGHLKLDDDLPVLAGRLRDAGYRTQAYVANPWVGKEYGFDRGFDTFDEVWRGVHGTEGEMGAGRIVDTIGRWLDWRAGNADARAKPFFVFVNFFEPHLPYNPPEEERARFLFPGADPARVERLRRFKNPDEVKAILGLLQLDDADRAVLSSLYDGEIAYVDRRVGELVDGLKARGLLDDTVVAVTSDHGEMLGEHGLYDHKLGLYEPVLRIPLVLRYPRRVPAGQRLGAPVMLQDLYPTLLGLAGVTAEGRPLPGVQGLGAAPARGGCADPMVSEVAPPKDFLPVLLQVDPRADVARLGSGLSAATCAGLKLIAWSDGRRALYDLNADPGEESDLAAAKPAAAGARAAWLRARGTRPGARGAFTPAP
jgi:arylsulfatase A-like enzyme